MTQPRAIWLTGCALAGWMAAAQAWGAGVGSWTAISDPGGTRELGTVTLLRTGQVLIAGGEGNAGVTAFSELFDPATNTYLAAAPLSHAREQASATLLGNGMVLVAGGTASNVNAAPLSSAELYNPATNSWAPTGSLHQARFGQQATLLADGRVLVMGGTPDVSTQLRSCEIWDPATGQWTLTGSMRVGRRYSSAVTLPDGDVLEAGDDAGAELYSAATGVWGAAPTPPNNIFGMTLALLGDGSVLAAPSVPTNRGVGATYSQATDAWTGTGATAARHYPAVTVLKDGSVMVAGGCVQSCSVDTSSVVRYNPAKRVFVAVAAMTYARDNAAAVSLPDGRVLMQGGFGMLGGPGPEIYTP